MSEVERIRRVYQGYAEDQALQSSWASENPGNQAIIRERMATVHHLLDIHSFLPLTDSRILEIGCGTGNVLATLIQWGASASNLYGIDLIPARIEVAKQNFPAITFRQANAEHLDFDDHFFDLIMCFTVFSSILDRTMAKQVAREAQRVLKPHGALIWYDFRFKNPRNPHTQPMRIKDIQQLFPTFTCHLRTVTLLPPIARHLGLLTQAVYPVLSSVSLLRTHYTGLLINSKQSIS